MVAASLAAGSGTCYRTNIACFGRFEDLADSAKHGAALRESATSKALQTFQVKGRESRWSDRWRQPCASRTSALITDGDS